ncbi:MAG: YqeG family HAD IIIA-type phosphatase [Bacilli bacterium]
MNLFLPSMYKKSIYTIDYSKLKKANIRYLIFDLDNTIGLIKETEPSIKTKKLFQELSANFEIIVISNNTKKRVTSFLMGLDITLVSFAFKPFTRGLRKISKKFNCSKEEMIIIGDQLLTDILAGKRYKIKTILVDPLGKKDLAITSISRLIEKKIFNYYKKQGLLERGKYYD